MQGCIFFTITLPPLPQSDNIFVKQNKKEGKNIFFPFSMFFKTFLPKSLMQRQSRCFKQLPVCQESYFIISFHIF